MLGLTKRATDTEIKKVRRPFEPTAESTVGPLRIPKLLWPVTLVRRTVRWRLCTIPTATRRLMTRGRRRRRSSSRSSARSAADCHRRNHSPTYSFALSLAGSQAFEILSDQKKKQQYDEGAEIAEINGSGGGGCGGMDPMDIFQMYAGMGGMPGGRGGGMPRGFSSGFGGF